MKVLQEVLSTEKNEAIHAQEIIANPIETRNSSNESPDYTQMMIEVEKISDPVSFESLKDFYQIE